MPGTHHLEQRRVDDEDFGVAHKLGQDVASEGLQETPQLAKAAVQRGRLQVQSPGEQVGEEPAHITQERALALHAPKLPEERQGEHLGVRELLEELVALAFGVEDPVGVVDEAE